MAGKSMSFNHYCNLCDSHIEQFAKWLSCNGELWGIGPTVVFASAACMFLYHELEATILMPGDHADIPALEKTLISTMMFGMLALMIHIWVCSMRIFEYYLDMLIKESPSVLLEMTTAGLLGGGGKEMAALGPLTKFLRTQQPQIHITVCWFLSLCYADYVRKHYCQRFNLPYLEQWQTELQDRTQRGVQQTMQRVNSFVGSVQRRLRGFVPAPTSDVNTESVANPDVPLEPCPCGPVNSLQSSKSCQRSRSRLEVSETTSEAIQKIRGYLKCHPSACPRCQPAQSGAGAASHPDTAQTR